MKLPKNLSTELKSILKPMSEAPLDGSWIFVVKSGNEDDVIKFRIIPSKFFMPTQEQMENKVLPHWEYLDPTFGFCTLQLDEVFGWFKIWEK